MTELIERQTAGGDGAIVVEVHEAPHDPTSTTSRPGS